MKSLHNEQWLGLPVVVDTDLEPNQVFASLVIELDGKIIRGFKVAEHATKKISNDFNKYEKGLEILASKPEGVFHTFESSLQLLDKDSHAEES
jgi:predicted DNA-binding protein (UPF0278 family)